MHMWHSSFAGHRRGDQRSMTEQILSSLHCASYSMHGLTCSCRGLACSLATSTPHLGTTGSAAARRPSSGSAAGGLPRRSRSSSPTVNLGTPACVCVAEVLVHGRVQACAALLACAGICVVPRSCKQSGRVAITYQAASDPESACRLLSHQRDAVQDLSCSHLSRRCTAPLPDGELVCGVGPVGQSTAVS